MLFSPKSFKYKKHQKGSFSNKLSNLWLLKKKTNNCIKLISASHGRITTKQLIAVRFLIRKFIKKKGFLIFRIFPQKPVSKKSAGIRMGKGKGSFDFWAADIKAGVVICEILYKIVYKRRIIKILKRASLRLPLKTKIKSL